MIPVPDTIPVHWLWFEVLLVVTFLLHLLLMNGLLGTSLISSFNFLRGKEFEKQSLSLPTLVALTVNFGIPPLLFIQVLYGNLFYSSTIIMALPWLLIIPLLIVAYYCTYIFVFKKEVSRNFAGINIIIASIILLYIGFMMTNNYTLMLVPESWKIYFENDSGKFLNLSEPTLIPRYLHFVVAAIAISGLWKSVVAKFKNLGEKNISIGLKIFAYTTIIQIVIGLWFLLTLPSEMIKNFMGNDVIATAVLILAIVSTLLSIFSALKGKLNITIITAIITVFLMILQREFLMRYYLNDIFKPEDMVVDSEYGSLIMFLITFIIGLIVLYYMIRMIFKSKAEV
ncbi:MAG: hypothetical protein JXR48_06015 [Candidatus Delongbacteria bacterium]|nr:hypothetical protein [Candidatus Delongbacteria bacterium]MBN2834506.1 hypothetical protein [Candidatus Delongbacteria bacterium]